MRSIPIKVHGPTGNCSLGSLLVDAGPITDPGLGTHTRGWQYWIRGVPDHVEAAAVLALFRETTIHGDCYELRFEELGPGKVVQP